MTSRSLSTAATGHLKSTRRSILSYALRRIQSSLTVLNQLLRSLGRLLVLWRFTSWLVARGLCWKCATRWLAAPTHHAMGLVITLLVPIAAVTQRCSIAAQWTSIQLLRAPACLTLLAPACTQAITFPSISHSSAIRRSSSEMLSNVCRSWLTAESRTKFLID